MTIAAWQKALDELDGAIGRALLADNQFLGTAAELVGESGIGQAAADERFEILFVTNHYRGLMIEELRYHVAKIPGVGTKGDGRAISCGLNHVLATTVCKAAADEGNLRRAPPIAEFANGVDKSDARGERGLGIGTRGRGKQ